MISRLALVFLLVGCSGGGGDGQTKAAPAPAAPAAASPPPDPDAVIVEAKPAANVTGSYLVGCSSSTQRTFLKDEVPGEDVTACIVLTADNKRADVEVLSLDVLDTQGGAPRTPANVALEVSDAPWHIGVALTPEEAKKAFSVTLHGRRPDGSIFDVVTQNLDFDYRTHPDFQAVLTLVTSLSTAFEADATFMEDFVAKGYEIETRAHYHTFLSISLVTGSIGTAAADSVCQKEGDRVTLGHKWFALLHTTAKPANVLFAPTSELFNFAGGYVSGVNGAHDRDAWWGSDLHVGALRYMSDGRNVASPLEYSAAPEFNRLVWTGFDKSGNADPAGNCKDWTSSEPTDFGGVGDGRDLESWTMFAKRPCSRLAHLICISELVDP